MLIAHTRKNPKQNRRARVSYLKNGLAMGVVLLYSAVTVSKTTPRTPCRDTVAVRTQTQNPPNKLP
jgi:hypothetical protein